MATILITGGTGLIGKALTHNLLLAGHEVRILSRNPEKSGQVISFYWDVEKQQIDDAAFDGLQHIVHLAGAGIADKRWTSSRKKEIVDSRIKSMQLITDVLKRKNIRLKSFVGASAVGIYGMHTSQKIYSETDTGTPDFLTEVCTQWEHAYQEMASLADRVCIVRIGVVLSKNGGALKKLTPLFKSGLGSAIGSGKQFMPWIHIDDLVSVFCKSLFDPNYSGIYNAVSTQHITNEEFSKQLAGVLSKPFFMPNTPGFLLRLVFGEMSGILLEGSKVSNQKLLNHGFLLKYPNLRDALEAIV